MKNFLNKIKTELATLPKTPLREKLSGASGSFAKGYHVEFLFGDKVEAEAFCTELAEQEIFAHIAAGYRVYLKDSESICNLLALAGCNKSLLLLHDEIVRRSVVNASMRRANCDAANIKKQLEVARAQVERIKTLISKPEFLLLPHDLQFTAHVRVDNPMSNYEELAEILGITKSGVVHRLKKLVEIMD